MIILKIRHQKLIKNNLCSITAIPIPFKPQQNSLRKVPSITWSSLKSMSFLSDYTKCPDLQIHWAEYLSIAHSHWKTHCYANSSLKSTPSLSFPSIHSILGCLHLIFIVVLPSSSVSELWTSDQEYNRGEFVCFCGVSRGRFSYVCNCVGWWKVGVIFGG
jgi:hypothetical protein